MRGKLLSLLRFDFVSRITPAYAGKTSTQVTSKLVARDHPRVCGENVLCWRKSVMQRGSPPRMRGKRLPRKIAIVADGITPAYAGKTDLRFANLEGAEDHPRVCGENRMSLFAWWTSLGSPPRMRGKRTAFETGAVRDRITPAYAGKTLSHSQQHL